MAYAALRGALYDRDDPRHPLTAWATVEVAVIGKHPRPTKLIHKFLLRGGERLRPESPIVRDDLMPAAIVHPGNACADRNGDVLRDKLEDLDGDGDRGGRLLRRRRPDWQPGSDGGGDDAQQYQPARRAQRCGSTLPAVSLPPVHAFFYIPS